jgi:hypothetical protein
MAEVVNIPFVPTEGVSSLIQHFVVWTALVWPSSVKIAFFNVIRISPYISSRCVA